MSTFAQPVPLIPHLWAVGTSIGTELIRFGHVLHVLDRSLKLAELFLEAMMCPWAHSILASAARSSSHLTHSSAIIAAASCQKAEGGAKRRLALSRG